MLKIFKLFRIFNTFFKFSYNIYKCNFFKKNFKNSQNFEKDIQNSINKRIFK